MALSLATTLSFYKRQEVQKALVRQAAHKEVAIKLTDSFGKRPDALYQEGDVLDCAMRKATSFHCSEELWSDPLLIKTGMSKGDTASLRIGWDLILDIDCPDWDLSRVITTMFINALEDHGIGCVTVKFSGNKGFHIAVPFQAFPDTFNNQPVKDLFPDAPRRIARYLLSYISSHYTKLEEDRLVFALKGRKIAVTRADLSKRLGKPVESFFSVMCSTCGSAVREGKTRYAYACPSCGYRVVVDSPLEIPSCPKCRQFMQELPVIEESSCECHRRFRRDDPRFNPVYRPELDVLSVVEVDTILIAPRHLYRMPYSFHEKSGLVSVPLSKSKVLTFSKESAKTTVVDFKVPFLDRKAAKAGEATTLLLKAYEHDIDEGELFKKSSDEGGEGGPPKEYEIPAVAIPEEHFPPCITAMMQGLKDGKKRALFTLISFLRGCGWSMDMIDEFLTKWNARNPEPLREVVIKGRLAYERTKKDPLPPHNCRRYYQDFGVCKPDSTCEMIKNPLQYAKKKAARAGLLSEDGKTKARAKLTEEQKAMRKAFREKAKGKEEELEE